MSKSNKKNALSLATKMELLEAVSKNELSKTEICYKFNVPKSTLSTIIKQKEKIEEAYERSRFEPERKLLRTAKYCSMEEATLIWFKQARAMNLPISGSLLGQKAEQLAQQLGTEFHANSGWLDRFKNRHGLVFKSICGESAAVSEDAVSDWHKTTLQAILREYKPADIFNADETGLFYRCLPDKTLCLKGDVCSGGKRAKDRLNVLVGANMDGSEKLPLLVIGKFLNPRCFKNTKRLPVEYTANKNAWMNSNIFLDWLTNLDKRFCKEKKCVAMIVDNCPAHSDVQGLKAIKLIFLPPNATSKLQPCD